MSIKRSVPRSRRPFAARQAVFHACEALEPRTLLSAIPADGVIGKQVVIKLTGPNDALTLSSHSRLGVQFFVDYSINGGPTTSVGVFPGDMVFVDAQTGTDTVNVLSTIAAVSTSIQSESAADDILNVGGPSGLQAIHGQINVTNTAGFWDITADDTGDPTSRTGLLFNGILSSLAPADILWDDSKCHGLAIDTGSHGGAMLYVMQTDVPTTIRGHSSGADDLVTIGNSADGLGDIKAALSVGNEPRIPSGLINLTLDDQADPVFGDYALDDGSLGIGTNNSFTPKVTWNSSALRSVTLKTEGPVPAQSPALAQIVNTNVATTLIGDTAGLEVDIGKPFTGSPMGILGNVFVTDPAGNTHLSVQPGAAVAPTVMLHTIAVPGDPAPYGAIVGLAPATIAYRYADTASVAVGGGGQKVQVAATGTNVFIEGSPAVSVGDAGSAQNIEGTLSIFGPSATVDDSSDPTVRNATISLVKPSVTGLIPWAAIGGLSPGSIEAFAPATSTLTIDGGTADNTYTVNAPPLTLPPGSLMPHVAVVLNTGGGKDSVQVLASGLGKPLTINGQGGNDAFTVNYSASIADNLIFNGGTGADTLTLMGPMAGALFSLTPGTVTFGTLTTTYTAIKTLSLATGAFTVTGDLGGVDLSTSGFTTVKIQASTHLGVLGIGGGTQVTVAPGAMPLSTFLFCTGLSIGAGGKLDLANNALELTYAGADPVSLIRSYLASGYNSGAWNGSGIVTSAGDATHALGFGDSADGIVPGLPANTLLVRWTRYGDVNLDGAVGFADLLTVARNYGKTGQNWDQGDMNYDGAVAFDDLVTVARNYGAIAALRPAAAIIVPTPLEMPIRRRKRR